MKNEKMIHASEIGEWPEGLMTNSVPNSTFGWIQSSVVLAGRSGIYVTSVAADNPGWMVAFHCSKCRKTTFLYHPWAVKPEKGDYQLSEMCPDDWTHGFEWPPKLEPWKGVFDGK